MLSGKILYILVGYINLTKSYNASYDGQIAKKYGLKFGRRNIVMKGTSGEINIESVSRRIKAAVKICKKTIKIFADIEIMTPDRFIMTNKLILNKKKLKKHSCTLFSEVNKYGLINNELQIIFYTNIIIKEICNEPIDYINIGILCNLVKYGDGTINYSIPVYNEKVLAVLKNFTI